jgi:hypothetical protein
MFNDSLQHALIVEGWLEIKDFLESMKTSSGHFDNDFFFYANKVNSFSILQYMVGNNYKIGN